ncbi:MAG: hypothetical protein OEZ47_11595 [Gammaproteobacteria bacterium]|nr:hypothetical protein [Gammaproteobacteria bacterium]
MKGDSMIYPLFSGLLFFLSSVAISGETDESMQSILGGFEGTTEIETIDVGAIHKGQSPIDYSLLFDLSTSYKYDQEKSGPEFSDYSGFNRAKIRLFPEIKSKLGKTWQAKINANFFVDAIYQIRGRKNYTKETLDAYETESDLWEAYIQGAVTSNLDLKLGRQIVLWGKSDGVRVVDVLNPLDKRELGMVDIADLRIPLTMAKLDYYFGQWQLSALAIPELSFGKLPSYGSEFYPVAQPLPNEELPEKNVENFEYASALNGRFNGWDLSFHAATYYDDNFHFAADPTRKPTLKHSRITMLGSAINYVIGNSVLKAELATKQGFQYFSTPSDKYSRIDSTIGIDISGFNNTLITVELADEYTLNYDSRLSNLPDQREEHEVVLFTRISMDFLREKLNLSGVSARYGIDRMDGGFSRIQLSYELFDTTTFTLGSVVYQSGNKQLFQSISDNDRVFAQLTLII